MGSYSNGSFSQVPSNPYGNVSHTKNNYLNGSSSTSKVNTKAYVNPNGMSLKAKDPVVPPKKKNGMEDNIARLKGMTNDFFSDM